MLKKLFTTTAGIGCVLGALFAALCTTMAIGDIAAGVEVDPAPNLQLDVSRVIFAGGVTSVTIKLLNLGNADAPFTLALERSQADLFTVTPTSGIALPASPSNTGIDITLEARLLRVAQSKGGRVTPIEVALECGTSIDVATAALDQLVMRGHAELAVADEGSTLYVLRGFLSVAEKAEAEVVLG